MLKENNEKWKNVTAEVKEDCLDFMLEILNIKIVDDEDQHAINRQLVLVADLIQSHFSVLTAPEIKEAMKMYVSKRFLQVKVFRLIDCVSIGEILTAYIEFRNQNIEPFLNKRKNLLLESVEVSQKEKEKIREDYLKTVFNEIAENSFSDSAHFLYNDLCLSGRVSPTDRQKKKLYREELAKHIPEERETIRTRGGISTKTLLADFQKFKDAIQ